HPVLDGGIGVSLGDVQRGVPILTKFLERRRASSLRISRNVNGECCSARSDSARLYVYFGVENRTTTTITGANPRVQIIGSANRVLLWSGHDEEDEIDIDPTPDRFHTHAVLAEVDQCGCKLGLAYYPEIRITPNTPHDIVLLITGTDTSPATQRARILFTP